MRTRKLLIAGNPTTEHVGAHLYQAAQALGYEASIYDTRIASQGPRWMTALSWRLSGRRPLRIASYGRELIEECERTGASLVIATGIAPITREVLLEIGRMGIGTINYLTDDPWNPWHRAPWFFKALPHYDQVFTPRRANLKDLERSTSRPVSFLPFGYSPELHLNEPCSPVHDSGETPDVIFVGGADDDRVPYIAALANDGFKLALYGGYWDRYHETRQWARGIVPGSEIKKATAQAKIALCLVRRANRDRHVMRTFEIPASGGCMLAEWTQEHEEIFGAEGRAVLYFRSIEEMLEKARWLIDHPDERQRLASAAHQLITRGAHTYQDRLTTMLALYEQRKSSSNESDSIDVSCLEHHT